MNTDTSYEFVGFPKLARLSRDVILTEKIDGTSAQILISAANEIGIEGLGPEDPVAKFQIDHALAFSVDFNLDIGGYAIYAGSKNRMLSLKEDNFGFAGWVKRNAKELFQLGPGRHFGEWWGNGIQRAYGLKEKRFSLFNVQRWVLHGQTPGYVNGTDGRMQEVLPPCVGLVPILYRGLFNTASVDAYLYELAATGSIAAPGFMQPEGVVVHHIAGNVSFKKTVLKDNEPKSKP